MAVEAIVEAVAGEATVEAEEEVGVVAVAEAAVLGVTTGATAAVAATEATEEVRIHSFVFHKEFRPV